MDLYSFVRMYPKAYEHSQMLKGKSWRLECTFDQQIGAYFLHT